MKKRSRKPKVKVEEIPEEVKTEVIPETEKIEKPVVEEEAKVEEPKPEPKKSKRKKEQKIEPLKPLEWRKIGGGSLRFRGQIIKPNQRFHAHLAEIPKGFLNVLVCLDKEGFDAHILDEQNIKPVIPLYEMRPIHKDEKLWNVHKIDGGKRLNAEPLPKEKAVKLLYTLNK
jgi:hypothetical protein